MAEDFNKLRLIAKRLGKTEFQESWAFLLEIENQPDDLDIYIKDISYGPTEIANEPLQVGGRTMTYPTGAEPVTLSVTVRDNKDGMVATFFDNWANSVVNDDGTLNLPYGKDGYVRKIKRYTVHDKVNALTNTWEAYPVQRGDVTESREEAGLLEFPLTFIQFRS